MSPEGKTPQLYRTFSPERTDKSVTKSLKVCQEFSVFNDTSPCIWSRFPQVPEPILDAGGSPAVAAASAKVPTHRAVTFIRKQFGYVSDKMMQLC